MWSPSDVCPNSKHPSFTLDAISFADSPWVLAAGPEVNSGALGNHVQMTGEPTHFDANSTVVDFQETLVRCEDDFVRSEEFVRFEELERLEEDVSFFSMLA